MHFHFHWYRAPHDGLRGFLFAQFIRSARSWHLRLAHTQWDVCWIDHTMICDD